MFCVFYTDLLLDFDLILWLFNISAVIHLTLCRFYVLAFNVLIFKGSPTTQFLRHVVDAFLFITDSSYLNIDWMYQKTNQKLIRSPQFSILFLFCVLRCFYSVHWLARRLWHCHQQLLECEGWFTWQIQPAAITQWIS